MMPTLPPEQIESAQAASLDAWFALSNQTLAGLQKLVELNLHTIKATLAQAHAGNQKAVTAKDLQDLQALSASLLQPMCEQAQSYRRQLSEITSGVRAEFAKAAETHYEANKRKMQDVIDSAAKNAPVGSEAAVAAWQSALSATTTLCQTMQQTAKQVIEVAESTWDNATVAAVNAARQASAQGSRAAKR